MFLDLLTELTGRRRWVERSGGSSHIAPHLLRDFPTAKMVYLTRNGADTARSMSRHASYQLVQLRVEFNLRYGIDPLRPEPGRPVPDEVAPYLPDRLTADSLRERGNEVGRFVSLCAFFTGQADQAFADSPPEHLLRMRYEDLVADPVTELGRLGRFLEFGGWRSWVDRVAGRIRPLLGSARGG